MHSCAAHIAFIRKIASIAMLLVLAYGTVFADNAKKPAVAKPVQSAATVLPIGSGAVVASVKAVAGRTKAMARMAKGTVGSDSSGRDNQIGRAHV